MFPHPWARASIILTFGLLSFTLVQWKSHQGSSLQALCHFQSPYRIVSRSSLPPCYLHWPHPYLQPFHFLKIPQSHLYFTPNCRPFEVVTSLNTIEATHVVPVSLCHPLLWFNSSPFLCSLYSPSKATSFSHLLLSSKLAVIYTHFNLSLFF